MSEEFEPLGLSDEEFMKQAPPEFSDETTEDPEVEPTDTSAADEGESATIDEEGDTSASEEATSDAQEETNEDSTAEEVTDPDGDTRTEDEPFADESEKASQETSKKDSTDTKKDTSDTKEFDYKSAYEKVTQPFKANGVEMNVKDPEDIVRLMQMGANYAKKMAQLKPNLKLVKMLENNSIDEAKLNTLIDISKKDPKAIAKLVKESGIDPLEISVEDAVDYKPTNYSISDKEFNLDQVLDSIKDSPTFTKTIDVLTKSWDPASRTAISDNPEIITIINTHMENGVFEKVDNVIQQERSLGRLTGLSDIQAYHQTAEHLYQTGQLRQEEDTSAKPSETKPDPKVAANRNKNRKAVAPVRQTGNSKSKKSEDIDFLGLSDDDFLKKYAAG